MGNLLLIAAAFLMTVPALALRLGVHLENPPAEAALFGLAILGAAFLLSWGAEVAQMDVSQALAIAALALIAVLPEYAVSAYFAWEAGQLAGTDLGREYASFVTANMTGANRLLIGFGWPLVFFLFWLKQRRRQGPVLVLERAHYVELSYLAIATLYSFVILIKGIDLVDSFVLVALFALYVRRASLVGRTEPELMGPARTLGQLKPWARRLAVVFFFLWAALAIVLSAEPFSEGLLKMGEQFGISKFLLVQWLAPLASEAPEIFVATVFALRGFAAAGLGMLVSSKVNQWTLLIGTLPVVFSIALGRPGAIPLDSRQLEEMLLTSAQSAFALTILMNLRLTFKGAALMFALFFTQLLIPDPRVRLGFTGVYLSLALLLMLRQRGDTASLFRLAWAELVWAVRPQGRPPEMPEPAAPPPDSPPQR